MHPLSIAIPTYRRGKVLVDTLEFLLALSPRAAEILVLDQTEAHDRSTIDALQAFADAGQIRWVQLPRPSITHAMNHGLQLALQEIVLFLDDDIRPEAELLDAHVQAHSRHPDGLVAGRVIQPWQEGAQEPADARFGFASQRGALIHEFMGGNFSIRKELALQLRGFDENFVKVAYRFEAEFAHRFRAQGGVVLFEPRACVHHLKETAGGTRSYGDHLTTWRADHAVGAYYYSLRTGILRDFVLRPLRSVITRYHVRRPWRIPATLVAELSGMVWALGLFFRGARILPVDRDRDFA
jgi:GT2 family glycosyltransferase